MSESTTETTSSYFETKDIKKKLPKTVIFIFIITIMGLIPWLYNVAILFGLVSAHESVQDFYNNLSVIEYLKILLIYPLGLYASVQLLRLKEVAIKLYYSYTVFFILGQIYKYTISESHTIVNKVQVDLLGNEVMTMINIATNVLWIGFILFYVNRLNRQGLLKP